MSAQVFLLLLNIVTILVGIGSLICNRMIERANEVQRTLDSENSRKNSETLLAEIRTLQEGNRSIENQLTPFKELAKSWAPNAGVNDGLKVLLEEIQKLKAENLVHSAKLADRSISPEAKARMIAILVPHKGSRIALFCVSDPEAQRFGNVLNQILTDSGWLVGRADGMLIGAISQGGVRLLAKSPVSPHMEALAAAFKEAGIDFQAFMDPNTSDEIKILTK